jgi:hypothetical protein
VNLNREVVGARCSGRRRPRRRRGRCGEARGGRRAPVGGHGSSRGGPRRRGHASSGPTAGGLRRWRLPVAARLGRWRRRGSAERRGRRVRSSRKEEAQRMSEGGGHGARLTGNGDRLRACVPVCGDRLG